MVIGDINLHACGLKSAYYMKFHKLSTALACKVRYITRDKSEKSRFRVIADLGFASDQQNSHENSTFQLFIPSYVNNHFKCDRSGKMNQRLRLFVVGDQIIDFNTPTPRGPCYAIMTHTHSKIMT